jgi:AhpD family alkylhydroperoxidase
MSIYEDFHKRREIGNNFIYSQNNLSYKRFISLDSRAYKNGTIPLKYKELMGLVGSMVLRCNDCILYHLERAYNEGANNDELNEAMNIAFIIGGSIVIPHLRFALEAYNELLSNNENK